MKQTLHIFAKDVRRFWPEIVVSLAITAAFALIYPRQWNTPLYGSASVGFSGIVGLQNALFLAPVLVVLVPVSWWLLIARVIHGESLVGDRQFWLTRPYEWKKMLAAKTLFLVVFLYLPFVVAQLALLAEGGFRPFAYMPGLLFNLLLITGALVMPILAVSTVTSTLARMALSIVAVVLGFAAAAAVDSHFSRTTISVPSSDRFSIPFLICICGAAVFVQYAARRLWLSRLLLIGSLVLILVGMMVPTNGNAVDKAYAGTSQSGATIRLAPVQNPNAHITAFPLTEKKQVNVSFFLVVSGIPDGYAAIPNNTKVSIDAPNGIHWSSPWQAAYNQYFLPGSRAFNVTFDIDRSVYERTRSAPVQLHVDVAFTQARAGTSRQIPMTASRFSVPGFGVCTPQTGWSAPLANITGLSCLSAFHQADLTYLEVLWSNDPCTGGATTTETGVQGDAWVGNLENDPAELGITPVWTDNVSLSNGMSPTSDRNRPSRPRFLCPGTMLTYTRYGMARRFQTGVTIPDIQLPDPTSQLFSIQAEP